MDQVRITKLRGAFAKCLNGCIDGVTREAFLGCFPDLVQTHEATLTELHVQMTQIIKANVAQEFEKIIDELDLTNKLNKLGN